MLSPESRNAPDPRKPAGFWQRLSSNQRGAIWMMGATTGFTLNGALVKTLAELDMNAFQISFSRAFFALLTISPFVWRERRTVLRSAHWGIHILRGLAGATAMVCGFYAVTKMPLAEVTALGFTQPLFTTLLAFLLLGEVVLWRRWSATFVGFLGVLIMVRPGAETFEPNALAALTMALGIALAVTLVKRFPAGESSVTMLLVFCLTSIVITAPPALYYWRSPDLFEFALLCGIGVLGVGSQAMIIKAYRNGEASFIAPFDYSKLLLAGLIGFFLFDEVPDAWTFIGAAVITIATLYIMHRESVKGSDRTTPPQSRL
jgi:drug/metabolite transporter (DMT)-like permease